MQEGPNLAKRRKIKNNCDTAVTYWFQQLDKYLEKIDHKSILNEPERMFVLAETVLPLCPVTGSVLAPYTKIPDQAKIDSKMDHLTLMVCLNAQGQICPPLVVVPEEYLLESAPNGWGLEKTKAGKLSRTCVEEYIGNQYNEWLIHYCIDIPVLLLIDDRLSHMITPQFKATCKGLNIILYFLPPNCKDMQPADMSVFAAIKFYWQNTASEFFGSSDWADDVDVDTTINENNVLQFIQSIIEESEMVVHIETAFNVCGLFPFDMDKRRCGHQ